MLWLIVYLIVGIFYISVKMYPVARDVALRMKHDDAYVITTFIISIGFTICFSPFWIILFGFDVAKWLYKKRGKLHE